MKVLVVEDEDAKRVTLTSDLSQAGFKVNGACTAGEALDLLKKDTVDVAIIDLRLPGEMDGMELLRLIKDEVSPSSEVIIITGYGSIPLTVKAMRLGAWDFVTKPFDNHQLIPILKDIQKQMTPKQPSQEMIGIEDDLELKHILVGNSPQIRQLRRQIRIWASADCNVLLRGETGTGKDLIASTIHKIGKHHAYPYVKVSCAIFSEHLIENELFGHERGAFTGADQRKIGRFELAEHGTIYLDDVDDIPLKVQVKLLRVIEEKVFERVGSINPLNCNARIIASTKVSLPERISQGTFREDLYYRLRVCDTHLSPLRDRIEDIPLLAVHHLKRISGEKEIKLSEKVLSILQGYHWPGNVRELTYMLERAFINGQGDISLDQFRIYIEESYSPESQRKFKSVIDRTERELLKEALAEAGGNITHAAVSLGMKRTTFRDKLTKHGLV